MPSLIAAGQYRRQPHGRRGLRLPTVSRHLNPSRGVHASTIGDDYQSNADRDCEHRPNRDLRLDPTVRPNPTYSYYRQDDQGRRPEERVRVGCRESRQPQSGRYERSGGYRYVVETTRSL
jgi:hypothetical protein